MASVGSSLQPAQGSQFFDEGSLTTDGTTQTLISFTVPAGKTRDLSKVIVTCNRGGLFEIKEGSTVIGSGRTSPGEHNVEFEWNPKRSIAAGVSVSVEYTRFSWVNNSDVEAYVMAEDF